MTDQTLAVALGGKNCPHYHPGGAGIVTWREWELYPELQTPELGGNFTLPWWYAGDVPSLTEESPDGALTVPTLAARPDDLQGRVLPLWFRAGTGPGCFAVTVTLHARQACPEALLFVSRRRLAWRGALAAGQTVTVTVLCDVSPIYPAGKTGLTDSSPGVCEVHGVDVTLAGKWVCLQSVQVCPAAVPPLPDGRFDRHRPALADLLRPRRLLCRLGADAARLCWHAVLCEQPRPFRAFDRDLPQ